MSIRHRLYRMPFTSTNLDDLQYYYFYPPWISAQLLFMVMDNVLFVVEECIIFLCSTQWPVQTCGVTYLMKLFDDDTETPPLHLMMLQAVSFSKTENYVELTALKWFKIYKKLHLFTLVTWIFCNLHIQEGASNSN